MKYLLLIPLTIAICYILGQFIVGQPILTNKRRTKMRCLQACAEYILAFDSEWDDFDEHVSEGNDPFGHILSDAYIALNGLAQFEAYVAEVRAKVS